MSNPTVQILRNILNVSITILLLLFISVNLFTLGRIGLEKLAGM